MLYLFFSRFRFSQLRLDGGTHHEANEEWKVLDVTFPDELPTHCRDQRFYFGRDYQIRRIDYVTDIAGGVAAHYCYDLKSFDGLMIPTRRRVVRRDPNGIVHLFGPTSVLLEITQAHLLSR